MKRQIVREGQKGGCMSVFYGQPRATKGVTVISLIEEKAALYPEKEALKCNDRVLSYRSMVSAVDMLASLLQEKGVKKEEPVGIYLDRSEKMVVAILAVWKAGGAYVPLDPAHPKERNKYIIEKSRIGVILSQKEYENDLDFAGTVICLDQIWDSLLCEKRSEPENRIGGDNQLAYIIFTSGSTGNPKGVEVEQEGVVNYLLSVSDNLKLTDSARGLAVVTITFDISISELFLPLINGGTLVIADNETAKDGAAICRVFESERINLCGFTPSTAYMLLESGLDNLGGISMLIGGEPWSMSLAKQLLECGCNGLWNVYGPTETTIYSTMCQILPSNTYIPIGEPIDQTDIYVLDANMKPVSDGAEGDLYIGGIGVARGYYGNPELTAERFIANPVDPERGRIYKTGDIVKIVDGTQVVYVGRSDFQVKVHGYRIELGEIEAALARNEKVAQAVVVVTGGEQDAKIRAFVKVKPDTQLTAAELKEFAEGQVPYYMVPNIFTFLEEYPMTANRKVDRKALMAMEAEPVASENEFVAPRNEFEEIIAGIWGDLLNLEQVSVKDDFLELGGHSLLANRLVNRINKELGTTITLVEFFSRPMTVEEMAMLVEENLLSGLSEEELAELMQAE